MGEGEIFNPFRERLNREIDSLHAALKQTNEVNKPKPKKKKRKWWKLG